MCRIAQEPATGLADDAVVPTVSAVRAMIQACLANAPVQDDWIQDSATGGCHQRAAAIVQRLQGSGQFTPSGFGFAAKWQALGTKTTLPVYVTLNCSVVAGDQSRFNRGNDSTTHSVVIVAVSVNTANGKPFCLVYDPDVTATAEAALAWETALTSAKQIANPVTATRHKIEEMLIPGNNGLGPVFRKYYFDPTKQYPIKRY